MNFEYFVDQDGFARQMAHDSGEGPTWLTAGSFASKTPGEKNISLPPTTRSNRRLACPSEGFASSIRRYGNSKSYFAFEKQATLVPSGHAFRDNDADSPRLYFGEAVPHMRTANGYESVIDPRQYEAVHADVEFSDTKTSKPVKHHHGDGRVVPLPQTLGEHFHTRRRRIFVSRRSLLRRSQNARRTMAEGNQNPDP